MLTLSRPRDGTIGQILATEAARYVGVDITGGPVAMMRHRLCRDGDVSGKATFQASALDLPFPDGAFDSVYTVGCLHHTGNLARAVREVHRVLMPGGRAVVMLYYRHSVRELFRRAGTREIC